MQDNEQSMDLGGRSLKFCTCLKQGLHRPAAERTRVGATWCQNLAAEAWGCRTRSLLEVTPSYLLCLCLPGFQNFFFSYGEEWAAWIQVLYSWSRVTSGKGLKRTAQPELLRKSVWAGHTPQLESIVSFAPATLLWVYYKKIIRFNRYMDKAVCYSEELKAVWMSNNRGKIKITIWENKIWYVIIIIYEVILSVGLIFNVMESCHMKFKCT